ncbi:MAG TPA: hypothetical protein ACFE0H_16235 [Elainellaceae cyanobacterium]
MANRAALKVQPLQVLEAVCLGGLIMLVSVSVAKFFVHEQRLDAANGIWCVHMQSPDKWERFYGDDCKRVTSGYLRWDTRLE